MCVCVFCGTFPICLYFTILFVILLLALWWRHHPIDVTLSYYPHHHTLYAALSYECSCFVVAFIVSTRVFALHAQHICAPNPRRRLHNSYSNTLPSNPNSPIYVIKIFFFVRCRAIAYVLLLSYWICAVVCGCVYSGICEIVNLPLGLSHRKSIFTN